MKKNLTLNEIRNKSNFFWIKKIIVLSLRFFAIIIELLNKKKFYFKANNRSHSFFFGYHDKKPFNYKDSQIIFHSYRNPKILDEQNNKSVFINVIDLKNKKIFNLDKTKEWSWQLGSSLQWHPKKDIVFYNKQINGKFQTRQIDLKLRKITNLNFSIYNISPDGNNFLTSDFVKIGKLRKGYGYTTTKYQKSLNLKKSKLEIVINKKDKKILFLFDETKKKMVTGCYINHQTFSPDGRKIAYFYTILKKNNQRQVFFYLYFLKKKRNFLLELSKSKLISHYCWKNNNEILFTLKKSTKIYSYILYNIKLNNFKTLDLKLNKDGHPMFNPKNNDLFVSDTYPNLLGFQKLFIYSLKRKKIIWKKYLYSPYRFKGIVRCDLHPRWSNDGKKIFIDFVENGNRNIGIFETKILEN